MGRNFSLHYQQTSACSIITMLYLEDYMMSPHGGNIDLCEYYYLLVNFFLFNCDLK